MNRKKPIAGSDPGPKEPTRLLALSDGLFATVLTLLVLDLRPPDGVNVPGWAIHDFIRWVGPRLFAYLITFIVSGNYWLSHHRNFDRVAGNDRGLLSYNLVFLLFIGLLPFSTAAMSAASLSSGAFRFYWAVYAGNLMLAGVMLGVSWEYAVNHGLIKSETSVEQIRNISLRHVVAPGIFAVSIIVQWLFPKIFLGPYILLLIPAAVWAVDRLLAPSPHAKDRRPFFLRLLWGAGRVLPWVLVLALSIWAMNV